MLVVRGLARMRRLTRVGRLAGVVVACRTGGHAGLWGLAGVGRVTWGIHRTLTGAWGRRLEW